MRMTRRHANEVVVARWTVDPERLREFTQHMRSRYGVTPFTPTELLDVCERHSDVGLEVVCRDDAVFVGPWCLAFLYNEISAIRFHETWLQFEMEGGLYELPVPIARHGRADAERVVEDYRKLAEEETRRAIAARQAPTWSNALLDIAEAHWIWVILGFFFLVIPAVVFVICLLRDDCR